MIPLVGFKKELDLQVQVVHETAKAVMAEKKAKIAYSVGTMIEVPRGALTANDLTQTALGMSRDDSGSFLPSSTRNEIVRENPFVATGQSGVGQIM